MWMKDFLNHTTEIHMMIIVVFFCHYLLSLIMYIYSSVLLSCVKGDIQIKVIIIMNRIHGGALKLNFSKAIKDHNFWK